MSGQRRAISSPRGLLQSTARWRLTTSFWPQPCGGAWTCNRSLALCEGASVALVGPAARRPRKCSVVLRVASVVCALILVATTPKCAVWVVAVRHAMIRSWSRLGARCVTWAASRESSASVQVVCAGKVQSLRPGGSTSMHSAKHACVVDVAVKHPCAEAIEAAATLRNGFSAPFLPEARR